jgi:hypothetical protein
VIVASGTARRSEGSGAITAVSIRWFWCYEAAQGHSYRDHPKVLTARREAGRQRTENPEVIDRRSLLRAGPIAAPRRG